MHVGKEIGTPEAITIRAIGALGFMGGYALWTK